MPATQTRRPRPKCRNCGLPAANKGPLVNGYCSDGCHTAAILNRR
jgi:hypothetical protein